jgi:hypothetical protein
MIHYEHSAIGEEGQVVGIENFPFDEIDRRLGFAEQDNSAEERDFKEIRALQVMLRWIMANQKSEGILIRALIVCWTFLPELHPLELTELANKFGKHKQSFGRWHDDFKILFPEVRTQHMRHNEK